MSNGNGHGPGLVLPFKDGVPIVGQRLDEAGIKALEEILAKMKTGEIVNVALVAQKKNGDMAITFSPGSGDKLKQVGGVALLLRRIEDSILEGG